MPRIATRTIEIEYESFGPASAPAVLLVMGLGAQFVRWNREFCDLLVAGGYRVIRFDNRDCGLSTRMENAFLPDIGAALRSGQPPSVPYTLDDMAADSIDLLDALDIAQAHWVGASMGAAIAQVIAARFPERTRSLTSIMSSTGNPLLPPPRPEAAAALYAPLPARRDRAAIVADGLRRQRVLASPAYPHDFQPLLEEEYDRGFYPKGVGRQLAAILASGDRRAMLQTIKAPTVVLHGADDPLIQPACGEDVAANIAGAELRIVPGMGHDFPPALSGVFADAVGAAARRHHG